MAEKIKISVPEKIYDLLRKDAKDFRILKPSGEENRNAFINRLVLNDYEAFSAADEKLHQSIRAALSILPEKYAKEAFPEVVKAIAGREHGEKWGKSVPLSFKPTGATERATVYIENVLLRNETISAFYRRMFMSYAAKPKDERERIIHKSNYELLLSAIAEGRQVCLSLENGVVYNNASVYAVEASRDELFNYALLFSDKKNRTIRLAKIRTVSLLAGSAQIPEAAAGLFARQVAAGAQYPMYSTDRDPIRVQLTEKGKFLFEKIYLYRPVPVSVSGDVYTFDCSANQALYYFERFGSEALILSPKRLGIFMRNYYYFALKKYRTVYGND